MDVAIRKLQLEMVTGRMSFGLVGWTTLATRWSHEQLAGEHLDNLTNNPWTACW